PAPRHFCTGTRFPFPLPFAAVVHPARAGKGAKSGNKNAAVRGAPRRQKAGEMGIGFRYSLRSGRRKGPGRGIGGRPSALRRADRSAFLGEKQSGRSDGCLLWGSETSDQNQEGTGVS